MLPLQGGQIGEIWEPPQTNNVFFGNRGTLDWKKKWIIQALNPCHGWDGWSPVFDRGNLVSFTDQHMFDLCLTYEGCPESIQPFWISREMFAWPWCNLAAIQWRPYCAFMNSHSPVGLVSRQWDPFDWACVLCDRPIHNDRASRSSSLR